MSSPVKLYVYDLSNGLARQLSVQLTGKLIEGIWHTSVVVFGKEVFYGQGIDITAPGRSHHGNPLRIIDMGETGIDQETFEQYLEDLREHYTADKYHLLDFNCNSFTNDCVGFLTGGSIPDFIKDLPADFLSTPFGAALRPTIDNMFRRPTPGNTPSQPATPQASLPSDLTANPELTASLLQAVAARAQASMSSTTGPSSSLMNQSLATPIHVATNPSSFQALLRSQRAVVAFFTSATCPPCKMIEPVFEQLAAEKGPKSTAGGSPGAAFTKIDLGTGLASRIASEYGVRATPTFILFLDGKNYSELKGANAGELRTQIDLLLFEAYPPHPHTRLSLPTVESLTTKPILFAQVPRLDTVSTKLVSFIDEFPESAYPSNSPRLVLKQSITETVIPYLKSRSPAVGKVPASASASQIATFSGTTRILFGILPATSLFPLVDLWRLSFLDPAVLSDRTVLEQRTVPSLVLEKTLSILSSAEGISSSRAYVLTTFRFFCNSFSSPSLAFPSRMLLDPPTRIKLTNLLVTGLLHADSSVRTAAASFAFNVSTLIQRQRMGDLRPDASGQVIPQLNDEDWEVELVSVIVEAIDQEKQSEEIVHRLVATLAFLLRLSPYYETQLSPLLSVLQAREILQRKLAAGGCGEKGVTKKDIQKLVNEVATSLCPSA